MTTPLTDEEIQQLRKERKYSVRRDDRLICRLLEEIQWLKGDLASQRLSQVDFQNRNEVLREENARLKKANEQTTYVLAAAKRHIESEHYDSLQGWLQQDAEPLLDNLKALRDGGE